MADDTREVRLDSAERYPFIYIRSGDEARHGGGYAAEVAPDVLARWESVMAEFEQVQGEMEEVHDEAVRRDAADQAIRKAEAEATAAARRLERLRYEQEHPPQLAESWPNPDSNVCTGLDYGSDKAALAERLRIHNVFGSITFDLMPYWCDNGHCHLRRRA